MYKTSNRCPAQENIIRRQVRRQARENMHTKRGTTVGAKCGKNTQSVPSAENTRKSVGFTSNWLKDKHLCSDYLLSNSGIGEKGWLSHANLRKRHTKRLRFLVNNQKQKVILACQKVETVMNVSWRLFQKSQNTKCITLFPPIRCFLGVVAQL